VAAICHARKVLAAAGVAKGRKMQFYPELVGWTLAGGHLVDVGMADAVVDGNMVTGLRWAGR